LFVLEGGGLVLDILSTWIPKPKTYSFPESGLTVIYFRFTDGFDANIYFMYKTKNIVLLVLNATLGSFYMGYSISYMNVSFDAMD